MAGPLALLVLSDRAAPPIDRPATLTEAVLRECARRSYGGIVLDLTSRPGRIAAALLPYWGNSAPKAESSSALPPSYAGAARSIPPLL